MPILASGSKQAALDVHAAEAPHNLHSENIDLASHDVNAVTGA